MSGRVLLILLAGLVLLTASNADAGVLSSVDASPLSIPADGSSRSQILITVVDNAGAPVADNTEVHLTTSAGDITPVVYTSGGRAIGILTSSTFPEIATVDAIVNGASESVQVEFLSSADDGEISRAARTIRMSGGSLAYSVDKDIILGSSGVTIEYQGLTITADAAQVCHRSRDIRAQGEVSVGRGDQVLYADSMACEIGGDRIRLHHSGGQDDAGVFHVRSLEAIEVDDAKGGADDSLRFTNVDSRTWIVSDRLVLVPGDKILFYKAAIYVGDVKVITMPYYSYNYRKRESILQQVRFTSDDGMLVDLPFFYQVSDSKTGALKLRYAANGAESGGYYRPPKGVSLGLEQNYSIGNSNRGRFFIDSVGSSSQAFELAHHLEFGAAETAGRADISARYQPSTSYAKDIHSTSLNVTGNLHSYNYTFWGYLGGSSFKQYDPLDPESVDYVERSNGSFRTTFRPNSQITSKQLGRISPSMTIGYRNLRDSSGETTSPCVYQSWALGFSHSNMSGRGTGMSYSGKAGFTVTADGDLGASLRLGPSLRTRMSRGTATLSYTLNLQDGVTDNSSSLATHQLGCNLFLYGGGRWSSHSSITYGLDTGRLNLYSMLNYRVADAWQVRCRYNLYKYSYDINGSAYRYENSYLKTGIYRALGPYEIGLAWSPDGQNYGIDSDKMLWLEFGGRGF